MPPWTGVALALSAPGGDEMHSRLSTYLHPLAGRPLVWHALAALAGARPAPARLLLLLHPEVPPDPCREAFPHVEIVIAEDGEDLPHLLERAGVGAEERVLLADAAAPGLRLDGFPFDAAGEARVVRNGEGASIGLWMSSAAGRRLLGSESALDEERLRGLPVHALDGAPLVHSRESLARAARDVRSRLIRQQMEEGVTFLLPETVLLDVDVRIGRDTVIYPGVMIEGQTTIGEETVIGPGCRILDSWVGSGVELKGWNFIARTSLRNRAILEPYVRRGFD
jgi:hypothetical protein